MKYLQYKLQILHFRDMYKGFHQLCPPTKGEGDILVSVRISLVSALALASALASAGQICTLAIS